MSSIPQDLLYTTDHEYVKKTADAGLVLVGITAYAQGELGDIVYLEMPAVGKKFAAHQVFGRICWGRWRCIGWLNSIAIVNLRVGFFQLLLHL